MSDWPPELKIEKFETWHTPDHTRYAARFEGMTARDRLGVFSMPDRRYYVIPHGSWSRITIENAVAGPFDTGEEAYAVWRLMEGAGE